MTHCLGPICHETHRNTWSDKLHQKIAKKAKGEAYKVNNKL